MKTSEIITKEDILLHEEKMNLWEMANLRPKDTGLNVVIWVSSGQGVKHGPRIKVCSGPKWDETKCSTIPLTGIYKVIGNADISQEEFSKIVKWIEINKKALLDFWNGKIQYTQDLLNMLKPLVGDEK